MFTAEKVFNGLRGCSWGVKSKGWWQSLKAGRVISWGAGAHFVCSISFMCTMGRAPSAPWPSAPCPAHPYISVAVSSVQPWGFSWTVGRVFQVQCCLSMIFCEERIPARAHCLPLEQQQSLRFHVCCLFALSQRKSELKPHSFVMRRLT